VKSVRCALLFGALAVLGAVVASPASAATAGGCQLQGTASFSPGLSSTSQPFSYSFAGGLTGCQSSEAGAPATGTVRRSRRTAPRPGEKR